MVVQVAGLCDRNEHVDEALALFRFANLDRVHV